MSTQIDPLWVRIRWASTVQLSEKLELRICYRFAGTLRGQKSERPWAAQPRRRRRRLAPKGDLTCSSSWCHHFRCSSRAGEVPCRFSSRSHQVRHGMAASASRKILRNGTRLDSRAPHRPSRRSPCSCRRADHDLAQPRCCGPRSLDGTTTVGMLFGLLYSGRVRAPELRTQPLSLLTSFVGTEEGP
ncbi:hypothetical protein P3T23_005087 [Paraburkholderia sp. GAS448]